MGARDGLTAAAVVAAVERGWGAPCARCSLDLLGHEVVLSLLLGWRDTPCCAACLARAHGSLPAPFLARGAEQVRRLACYRAGWAHADRRLEALGRWPEERIPSALRMDAVGASDALPDLDEPVPGAQLLHADALDAGDKGCGELVLELRVRMKRLAPGDVLRLVAQDPGAPEDLPAWCRLTGHRLRAAEPPVYWIERKPD